MAYFAEIRVMIAHASHAFRLWRNRGSRSGFPCKHNALPFEAVPSAEIDEKPKGKLRGFQIVDHLRTVLARKFFHGFEFHDDLVITQKIRRVSVPQNLASILKLDISLCVEGNPLIAQLDLDAILINRLREAMAFVVVNRHACPDEAIHLFPKKDSHGINRECANRREGRPDG